MKYIKKGGKCRFLEKGTRTPLKNTHTHIIKNIKNKLKDLNDKIIFSYDKKSMSLITIKDVKYI